MNTDNKNISNSTKSKIIGIVFLAWFLCSVAGAILASKAGQSGWVAFLIGQVFFVVGIISVSKEKKEGFRQPIFIVFPVVGFVMMVCGFLCQTGGEAMGDLIVDCVPYLLLGLFFLVGILIVITALCAKRRDQQCTDAVLGKCVEVKWKYTSNGASGTMFYCPIYEYTYNGRLYTSCQEVYLTNNCVEEGDYREIFVNPKKPEAIFEKGRGEAANTILLCLGIMFITVSLMTLFVC